MKRMLVVCALALMLVLPNLAAANGVVTLVWKYDPTAGQFPSTVAVDKVGNVFVTLQALGQVRRISPDGEESLYYQFPPGAALFGVAVDAPGNLYVAVTTRGANPALSGVWRISRDKTATRLPGTGSMFLPNGLVFDQRGNLYVTDSYRPGTTPPAGAIWRIPRGGEAKVWLQDSDLLGGLGQLPGAPPVGANGIALDHSVLYVSNTEKGLILRIPVQLITYFDYLVKPKRTI